MFTGDSASGTTQPRTFTARLLPHSRGDPHRSCAAQVIDSHTEIASRVDEQETRSTRGAPDERVLLRHDGRHDDRPHIASPEKLLHPARVSFAVGMRLAADTPRRRERELRVGVADIDQ